MKYICKKDLPFVKKGEEVEVTLDAYGNKLVKPKNKEVENWLTTWEDFESWFEPKRWMPKPEDDFWFVYADGEIGHIISLNGSARMDHYNFGNCFQTKEQAEKARLLVIEALKKAHE